MTNGKRGKWVARVPTSTPARWRVLAFAGMAIAATTGAWDVAAQGSNPPSSPPPVYGGGRGNAPGGMPDIPPPPRMLEPGTSAEGDSRPATSQRQYCTGLLRQIEALPAAAPDRGRMEDAYRKECAQQGR